MKFFNIALPFLCGTALAAPVTGTDNWDGTTATTTTTTQVTSYDSFLNEILTAVNTLIHDIELDLTQIAALGHISEQDCPQLEGLFNGMASSIGQTNQHVTQTLLSINGPMSHSDLVLLQSILQAVENLVQQLDPALENLLNGITGDIANLIQAVIQTILGDIQALVNALTSFSTVSCQNTTVDDTDLIDAINALINDLTNLLNNLLTGVAGLLQGLLADVGDLLDNLLAGLLRN